MFFITMPKDFKVGDRADCRINKKPARVHWRDSGHLVIEPDDARTILHISRDDKGIDFLCDDGGGTYRVDEYPDGVVITQVK